MDSFEKWYLDKFGMHPNKVVGSNVARMAWVAALRRAAEIATDENCDQTEYRCLTVQRIGEAIEREASKLEGEG